MLLFSPFLRILLSDDAKFKYIARVLVLRSHYRRKDWTEKIMHSCTLVVVYTAFTVDFSSPGRQLTATGWTCRSYVAASARCRRSWTCRRTAACRAARRWRWRGTVAAAGWRLIAYCWWVTPRDYAATSSICARTTNDIMTWYIVNVRPKVRQLSLTRDVKLNAAKPNSRPSKLPQTYPRPRHQVS